MDGPLGEIPTINQQLNGRLFACIRYLSEFCIRKFAKWRYLPTFRLVFCRVKGTQTVFYCHIITTIMVRYGPHSRQMPEASKWGQSLLKLHCICIFLHLRDVFQNFIHEQIKAQLFMSTIFFPCNFLICCIFASSCENLQGKKQQA